MTSQWGICRATPSGRVTAGGPPVETEIFGEAIEWLSHGTSHYEQQGIWTLRLRCCGSLLNLVVI